MFIKAVETSCMIKKVPASKLTEGDWIVKNVYVKGKYITGPKELGITEEQIKRLPKKLKVTIKEGIPFVPSFLASYVLLLIFGNWMGVLF